MSQNSVQKSGCEETDFKGVVLRPRQQLPRTHQMSTRAQKNKSQASRQFQGINKVASYQLWRHESEKKKMQDSQQCKENAEMMRLNRIARECCQAYNDRTLSREEMDKRDQQSWQLDLFTQNKIQLEKVEKEIQIWKQRQTETAHKLNELFVERENLISKLEDSLRLHFKCSRKYRVQQQHTYE